MIADVAAPGHYHLPVTAPMSTHAAGARRRVLATYVIASALTGIAYIGTFQNASVAAPSITGTAATGGLPSSAAVAGTAIAAVLLSTLMASRGRRAGIVAGIGMAVAGAALMVAAILAGSFLLLLGGAVLTGFGNAAINLSRYAAADLYPPVERATAVSIVVWGSTVGAVLGPNLVGPANAAGEALGLPRFAGGFVLAVALIALAGLVAYFGPRARDISRDADDDVRTPAPAPAAGLRQMLGALLVAPEGRTALAALVSGQLVMVLIMTMTPYHLNHAGHGDQVIGLVISAHTFGMFALAPVSGRLTRHFGATPTIMAGFATLALAGVLGAVVPGDGGTGLMLPLFLLGFGWNMSFVAGSSLLASGEVSRDRARLQGGVDALIWGTAAVAGVVAGFVVELAGYAILCLAGAVLAVLLAGAIAAERRAATAAEA
jgi:MFS family permease